MGARERWVAVTAAALVLWGFLMLRLGFGPFEARAGVLALLTGWIVGAAGLMGWLRAPASLVGPLLVAAAVAWALPNLLRTPIGPVDEAAAFLQLIYAALLGHAVVALPDLRRRRVPYVALGVAYAGGLLAQPVGGLVVSGSLVVGLGIVLLDRLGSRSPSVLATVAGVGFGAILGAATFARWSLPAFTTVDQRPAVEIALIVAAIATSATAIRAAGQPRRLTDLVIDLGGEGGGAVARQLASALGDPTLEVAYALDDGARFVDAAGREVALPEPGAGRSVTMVRHGRRPVAALIHDPATAADPGVRSAIARAAELAGENAAFQAQVQVQLADIRASRRRLLDAADDERRSLRAQLDGDLGRGMDDLEASLLDPPTELDRASVVAVIEQLGEARLEMAAIADGLHPRLVEQLGIAGAVQELAQRSALPVEVTVGPEVGGGLAEEAALYFACSEALANAAKHARATSLSIRLARSADDLVAEIEDDGAGGTNPARGSGLAGLQERLEALGGSLRVADGTGRGTRIVATVPAQSNSAGRPDGGAAKPRETPVSRS